VTYKRKEIIGDCTLYLGNALDILPTLDRADLCVSDVPYRLTTGGVSKSSKTMSGIFAAHNYANDGQLVMSTIEWEDMACPIFAALKDDADCYIMCNDKNLKPALVSFTDAGFGLHNVLTWDKKTPTPNRWYMKNIEFTLYLWKGAAKTINDPSSKQGVTGNQVDQSNHPTEKPVWLMEYYISNSSAIGDVVLDPFMGSGTTLVACARLGRSGVGIELDEAHYDAACHRVRATYSQSVMAFSPPAKPKQEALL
jgi:DNA modification methylase